MADEVRKAIADVTATMEKNSRKAAKATRAVLDQATKASKLATSKAPSKSAKAKAKAKKSKKKSKK
ncbi:hypothetical protein [Nocardioides sp. B-3]|uniref:hypothetical protein n=1 Tax=Nocardioides sp. B-3 TaxID=2895565 RepID=UPI00215269DA|nr:hypothetical protein [Nocardioides sp. B-3]UUZ58633.1 hypothetical protein LP418_21240 [Nocardioides sp. B-3]